jgi:hypothetical protein
MYYVLTACRQSDNYKLVDDWVQAVEMVVINGDKRSNAASPMTPKHLFPLTGQESEAEEFQFLRKQVRADYFDAQTSFANGLCKLSIILNKHDAETREALLESALTEFNAWLCETRERIAASGSYSTVMKRLFRGIQFPFLLSDGDTNLSQVVRIVPGAT